MHTIGIVPCNDNLMIEFAQLMGLQETDIFESYCPTGRNWYGQWKIQLKSKTVACSYLHCNLTIVTCGSVCNMLVEYALTFWGKQCKCIF